MHQLRAEGEQVALAQQSFAHAVNARKFFPASQFFFFESARVGFEQFSTLEIGLPRFVDVRLVVIGGNQFILAARKELSKIVEELAGLRQASEVFQVELGHVTAQQDPVVDVFEHFQIRIRDAQDFFQAEIVKSAEPDAFGALAD